VLFFLGVVVLGSNQAEKILSDPLQFLRMISPPPPKRERRFNYTPLWARQPVFSSTEK